MNQRILTAIIALPILIASIILPAYFPETYLLFVAIVAFAIGAGLYEFFLMSKKMQLKADAGVAYIGSIALFVAFFFNAPKTDPDLLLITISLFIIALLISQTFRFQNNFDKLLQGVGVTLFGVFYVAFLGGFIVSLRTGFDAILSTKLLGYFILVIFASDSGAYFVGKQFGKNKLVPKISPNKTWEGLIGGIVLSLAIAAIATATFFPELPYKFSLPLAFVMAIVGVFGDLAESAIKRSTGTKDAANILPGHGGLLDRLDSLLFNAPILYYFTKFYFGN
ncbi:MAG: phosphatidate cytidylyltransferase [Pyrinomonadaceae bacterium]|nr:phosphatidate cytidylyltransferase [Pyrinomonadaceae bacterium]